MMKLGRLKKIGAKVTAFSLAFVAFSGILLSGWQRSNSVVRAEGIDYKTMQSAMLSYFHDDSDNEQVIDNMSNEEYRVWGIFLSNMYTPFNTVISNSEFGDYSISGDGTVNKVSETKDSVIGGTPTIVNRLGKQFAKDTKEASTASKMVEKVRGTILKDSKPLYLSDKCSGDKVGSVATVGQFLAYLNNSDPDWMKRGSCNGHYFCTAKSDGKIDVIVFSTHKDRISGQASLALSITAGMSTPTKVWQYTADIGSKLSNASSTYYRDNKYDDALKVVKGYDLYISPFGDILAKVGDSGFIVLVQGCQNPYTFDKSGVTLPLNTAIGMANFLSLSEINKWGTDKEKWHIKNDRDPFLSDFMNWDMHQDDWGNLSSFFRKGFVATREFSVLTSGTTVYPTGSYFTDEIRVKYNDIDWSIYQPNWSVYATRVYADNRRSSQNSIVNSGISVSILDYAFMNSATAWQKAGSPIPLNASVAYTKYSDFKSKVLQSDYLETSSVVNIATAMFNGDRDNNSESSTAMGNRWSIIQVPLRYTNTQVGLFYTGSNKKKDIKFDSGSYTAVEVKDLLRSKDLVEVYYASGDATNNICKDGDKSYFVASEALASVDSTLASALASSSRGVQGAYIAGGVNLWSGIYWAYMSQAYGVKIDASGTLTYDSSKTSSAFSHLPAISDSSFGGTFGQLIDDAGSSSDGSTDDSEVKRKQADIINWLYTILSPETHIDSYVTNWLKSMVDNLILSAHNAMIGADLTNLATTDSGTNVYHSVMGYITTPSVSQMPVVNWLYDNYMFIYIVLMVLVAVILIVYVMIHMRRIGQAVVIFIVMGFVLLLPHSVLNGGILLSNNFAESIFSNRFSYWAIVQHEETIVEEADTSDKSDATQTLVSNVQMIKNSQYGSGVTLKWLTPKKERFFGRNQMSNIKDASGDSDSTITMLGFYWLFSDQFQGESYNNLEDSGNAYLYRSYYSIYTSAKDGRPEPVTGKNAKNKKDSTGSCVSNYVAVTDSSKVSNVISNVWKQQKVSDKLVSKEGKGFTTISITGGEAKKETGGKKTIPRGYRDTYIGNSNRVLVAKNSYSNYNRITDALSNNAVNKAIFTLNHTKDSDFKFDNKATGALHGLNVPKESSSTPIGTGEKTFLLYTESPYYYFYNVFSTAKVGSAVGKTDFVSLLLSESFFKVTDTNSVAYDKTKDFLDLEGLFTYIIPYLNRANANVEKYMEVNGTTVKREDYAKEDVYNHSLDDMESMWNLYSPWVDAMYDIYGSSQTAQSGYDKVSITDPLNPASYYIKSRPMSYSPADARLKGYVESDLSIIEKKMQNVLERTRTDLLYLLNYKDFEVSSKADKELRSKYGSEVLISAAAMIATFNFNQEFSDTSFGGSGIVMYPQSYELKNMNYDSYLRLILQNATGKTPSLSTEGKSESIYSDIISETSFFTGLFLLLNDVLAVFAVPALKIVVIILFTLLGLLLAIFCMISPPEKILNVVLRNYIVPVLGFTALLCIHTWVVSLFVGEGATGVLGSQALVLTTEDPTVTLLLLIVCDLAFCFALYKLLRWSLALAYKYAKNILHSVKAIGATAAGLAIAGVAGSYKVRAKMAGAVGGAVYRKASSSVSRYKDYKSQASANERAEDRKRKKQVRATPSSSGNRIERNRPIETKSNTQKSASRRNKPKQLSLAPMSESQKMSNKQRYGSTKRVFRKVKAKDNGALKLTINSHKKNDNKGSKN